jgi:CubicO group peptidase (beta-lactamase class C family)
VISPKVVRRGLARAEFCVGGWTSSALGRKFAVMHRRWELLLASCLGLVGGGRGQVAPAEPPPQPPAAAAEGPAAPPLQDLAALLAPIRAKHGVVALGAAVLVDGRLAALGVDGSRRHGHPEPVTVEDLWHLGSCTKAMTATLLARYVDRSALAWSTTVQQGLPDLAERVHAAAAGITLEHLLGHRAGLPGGPPEPLWGRLFRYPGDDRAARTEVAATLLAAPPEAKPGERFHYSNAGYMVAAAMLERCPDLAGDAGPDWASRMQRELFAPLGIERGGFGMPGTPEAQQQPWGHVVTAAGKQARFFDNPSSLGPAGTVHLTLRDWAKFAALQLGVQPTPPLLSPEALRALHTPPPGTDYALGWRVTERPWAPGPILTHAGSNTMWFCVAWLAPAARFAVLVTCNQGDSGAACDAVAAACIQRFRPATR